MAKKPSTPISSFKHKDKRVNIPPQELSGFMEDEEKAPGSMLYPRDPSLDPQLVWQGKDEQDREDLAVPTVPVYIQEKIQPQVIVENVRSQAHKKRVGVAEPDTQYLQLNFFNDFNNLDFEDLVEFYQHEQNWTNRMVLGDSLLVMNSLAEKEGLRGQVQMIYLDPPYGIKFGSNWQSRLGKRSVRDGSEADLTREPEMIKAFRDTWELGIHSYLSYLRDRFMVARELLTENGSIFVQIGDDNLHLVRCLLDEIFGSDNIFSVITFRKTLPLGSSGLPGVCDYLLWYAKDKSKCKYRQLFDDKDVGVDSPYTKLMLENGKYRPMTYSERRDLSIIPDDVKIFRMDKLTSSGYTPTCTYNFVLAGEKIKKQKQSWRTNPEGMKRLIKANRVIKSGYLPNYVLFQQDNPNKPIHNLWDNLQGASDPIYVVQTNVKVLERCILMTTDTGDLVLDPTCGSGTTAYVAELWGRRWITIDTSRVSIALARMRLMSSTYPYYLLVDSPEGAAKEAEITGLPTFEGRQGYFDHDLRMGFVYQRAPHIMLKDIANNEEIDDIYDRYQVSLVPLRLEINQALGTQFEEWDMPRELGELAPSPENTAVVEKLARWWELRGQRQAAIDASIARRADVELLYDQPYEDSKRVRVSGPFTVESLSPHRVLSTDVDRPMSETVAEKMEGAGKFEASIIENLRASGVQNTRKNERLEFTRLETFSGAYLQGSGEYEEKGEVKRVAVCIGPEHGTVGPELIREAAKEATQGIGFDLLVVLGFAFDPHISEETKRYGRLMVLPARISPDLMMGDLLKKAKNANLFTVFGEPDIEIKQQAGKLVVELRGVDIFDPTTGEIRSSTADEIACWFIDDDYNGESFFVRQAYFTGMDEPYQKLSRTLRAEIDEAAWSVLYRTASVPFDRPKGGRIAVKVINDYGDEVLKVYEV